MRFRSGAGTEFGNVGYRAPVRELILLNEKVRAVATPPICPGCAIKRRRKSRVLHRAKQESVSLSMGKASEYAPARKDERGLRKSFRK